jgi:FKBP-type peptidyl-prolyl cis-trans isomerase
MYGAFFSVTGLSSRFQHFPGLLLGGVLAGGMVLLGCADPCATPENEAILAAAAAESGTVVTESGLVFRELKAGVGPTPNTSDRVTVHYEGRLANGTVFDSSIKRGRTATFKLSGVIEGWTEGLQMLKGGGKAKLTVPPHLAYGSRYRDKIPACSVLIFEIELFGITD